MEGYAARTAPAQAALQARSAALRGPLELMAAQTAIFCFFGALWLLSAANAAFIAASRAFGEESLAAAVAKKLLMAAILTTGALFYSFIFAHVFLLLWRVWSRVRKTESREAEFGWGGLESPMNGVGPVTNHVFIFFIMVMLLGMPMQVLAPGKESCEGRVGSMVTEIGSFHCSVLFCFSLCRDIMIRLWASRDKVKRGTTRLR